MILACRTGALWVLGLLSFGLNNNRALENWDDSLWLYDRQTPGESDAFCTVRVHDWWHQPPLHADQSTKEREYAVKNLPAVSSFDEVVPLLSDPT